MTVEVKTKLTIDDHATSALGSMKEGFAALSAQSEQAKEGFSKMDQVVSDFLTDLRREGVAKIKEFGSELVAAASHGQVVEQAVAGMAIAVQDIPWSDAKEQAGSYFESLQDLAVDSMQPIDDVEAGFNRLVEIGGATPQGLKDALDTTTKLANVAHVLGGNVEAWGQQFAFAEEGSIKVKSQIFQLLQPTGIFGDNAKKASEYWAKLSTESRHELLAKGLDQLSAKMGEAVPTFHDATVQLDNVWDDVKERFGGPIIEALTPRIQKLSQAILHNSGAIDSYAEAFGDHVSHWVDEASDTVRDGLEWIKQHEDEIGKDIKEAWQFAKEVVEFMVRHKESIGGAALLKGAIGSEGIGAAFKVANAVGGTAVRSGMALGSANGMTSFTGGAIGLGAFTAALASATWALSEYDDLMKRTEGGKSDDERSYDAIQRQFESMKNDPNAGQWDAAALARFDKMRANFIGLAEEIGKSSSAAAFVADAAYDAHRNIRSMLDPVDRAAEELKKIGGGGDQDWAAQDTAVGAIVSGFEAASTGHNAAVQNYIANMLSGDTALQTAFLQSANMSAAGFTSLAAMLEDSSKEFAEKLRGKASLAGGGAKETKPVVNFNGGQSFKIQQDFRDQDPDRIAVIFRNDVLRSAENRIQASTSTPFG